MNCKELSVGHISAPGVAVGCVAVGCVAAIAVNLPGVSFTLATG